MQYSTPTLAFHTASGSINPLSATAVDLWVDGVCIIDDREAMDASLAVACLMAAYFVYGIAYPLKLKNTLLFMQKYIFDIEESGSKIPNTVLRAYNMLAAE